MVGRDARLVWDGGNRDSRCWIGDVENLTGGVVDRSVVEICN